MALFKFVDNILKNKTIKLFNFGKHYRDFTYVDDVVNSIEKLIKQPPKKNIPFEIYNLGSNNPISLMNFLKFIENELGKKAKFKKIKMQKGDIGKTHADNQKLTKKINYFPKFNAQIGIKNFIRWFKEYK